MEGGYWIISNICLKLKFAISVYGTGSQSLLSSAEVEFKIVQTGIEWYETDETILPGTNSLNHVSTLILLT